MRTILSAAIAAVCALSLGATSAVAAKANPVLDVSRATGVSVVFAGHAEPRSTVVLERRREGGAWKRLATSRAAKGGRYRMEVPRPWWTAKYRVRVGKLRSEVHRVPGRSADSGDNQPETPAPDPGPATDECGERPEKSDGSLWACTFVDDFEGEGLDTTKWLVQETWYSGMSTADRACYVNDADTLDVSGGTLRLTATHGLAPFTCKSPYGDFETTSTAATVATRATPGQPRLAQTYGRFEVRAMFPDMAGMPGSGSGIWMYPQDHTYGAWPRSGEIDIAEWFSWQPALVHPSVHYAGEDPALSSGRNCVVPDVGTEFHTYAVEWTPTEMKFFYDGELCFEHAWTPTGLTGSQPFDHPFYLVLTQVLAAAPNAPTAGSPTSATMTIDWVRAWQ